MRWWFIVYFFWLVFSLRSDGFIFHCCCSSSVMELISALISLVVLEDAFCILGDLSLSLSCLVYLCVFIIGLLFYNASLLVLKCR